MSLTTPNRQPALALLFAMAVGCSGSGGGGCTAMTPIPGGRYQGEKTDNAVNIRLSPHGINYLNGNWGMLLETFAPGRQMVLPVACTIMNLPAVGDVTVADQGTASGSGRLDGQCTSSDQPAQVRITFTGFQLLPRAPDSVEVTLIASVATGPIYAATVGEPCLGRVKCSVEYDNSPPRQPNRLVAAVKFTIDTKWDKLLSFSVSSLEGTKICGSSGAPQPPNCLDPDHLDLSRESGNVCSYACSIADWAPLKNLVLQLISPMLQTQIREAIETQACEQCGQNLPACPQLPSATSTCDTGKGVCMDTATSKCVPRFLGMEGRIAPAVMLGSFGVPADSQLDTSMAAGSSVNVDQGVSLGTRGGLRAVNVADCVTPQAAPPLVAVPAPDFDAEADPTKGPYHVGLGISSAFINLSTHQAHQAGALCLSIGTATTGLLNTGLFKTFLPSLGKIATRDGLDAPMMVVLRPARAPIVTVGEGTYDPVTKKPVKPLLRLTMNDVSIDFYAMIDDRQVRLFSLSADISLPLSLIFQGCDSVTPALGDLRQLVTNIRTANSEILAEDPAVLADIIPVVIGFAEPALASALTPFALPQLGNFKLKINETKGVGNIAGTETYNHLGLYAQLMPANGACAVSAPKTLASLKRSIIPPAEQMRLRGQPLPWPAAILDVRALGMDGTPEFAYRIDQGMWTTFLAPSTQGEFEVSHPAFLLQGEHQIQIRSRMAEQPHGVSAPVTVAFRVDWDPPEVSLRANHESGLLEVSARDAVSPPEKLEYAYRVGEGAFGPFGPARLVHLEAVELAGGVSVRVRDESGNVGEASYRVPTLATRPDAPEEINLRQGPELGSAGCASAAGPVGLLGLLAFGGWIARRRRK